MPRDDITMVDDRGHVREAKITINGTELTHAQSMTVRVAIESLSFDCAFDCGELGDVGKLYMKRIDEIRKFLYRR